MAGAGGNGGQEGGVDPARQVQAERHHADQVVEGDFLEQLAVFALVGVGVESVSCRAEVVAQGPPFPGGRITPWREAVVPPHDPERG